GLRDLSTSRAESASCAATAEALDAEIAEGAARGGAGRRPGGPCRVKRVSAIDASEFRLPRRGRDSNPRGFRLPLFESGTINHSDTSPHRSLTFECVSPARIPTLAFEALGTNY